MKFALVQDMLAGSELFKVGKRIGGPCRAVKLFVTREEAEQYGAGIIRRKCPEFKKSELTDAELLSEFQDTLQTFEFFHIFPVVEK